MECVGSEQATQTAFQIARPGAIVGRVGLPHGKVDETATFFSNVSVHGGPAPVRAYLEELLQATLDGQIHPGEVFDFTVSLDDIAQAYAAMDERRAIKALVKVSEI